MNGGGNNVLEETAACAAAGPVVPDFSKDGHYFIFSGKQLKTGTASPQMPNDAAPYPRSLEI
jgi:hypothetical protein